MAISATMARRSASARLTDGSRVISPTAVVTRLTAASELTGQWDTISARAPA
jgi:hypothetical protein